METLDTQGASETPEIPATSGSMLSGLVGDVFGFKHDEVLGKNGQAWRTLRFGARNHTLNLSTTEGVAIEVEGLDDYMYYITIDKSGVTTVLRWPIGDGGEIETLDPDNPDFIKIMQEEENLLKLILGKV